MIADLRTFIKDEVQGFGHLGEGSREVAVIDEELGRAVFSNQVRQLLYEGQGRHAVNPRAKDEGRLDGHLPRTGCR